MRVKLKTKGITKCDLVFDADRILCDSDGFHFWLHEDPVTEHFVRYDELLAYDLVYEVIEVGKH